MTDGKEIVQGTIALHPRGFGFLNLSGPSSPLSAFVAPPDLNPFLAGDVVRATLRRQADGRCSADELALVSRTRRALWGVIVERSGRRWLRTDREVANTDWPWSGEGEPGECWLGRFEGPTLVAWRRVEGDLNLAALMARYDLYQEFSAEAMAQVPTIAGAVGRRPGRRDLRHLPTVTIDDPSTQDLDDAISVVPAGKDGVLHLLVSIADPSEWIPEGSPLDLEARQRGTSTYLADRVLPMLPFELSHDALSLLPGADRLALTVEMRIDPEGQVVAVDLYESVMRSTTRWSYQEVADWLEHGEETEALAQAAEILPWLRTAYARLNFARRRRGGWNLSETESAKLHLDAEGRVEATSPLGATFAHQMVERFMVAANEAVARWLVERGLPGVFRVHPLPDAAATQALAEAAGEFGFEVGFAPQLTPGALAAFDAQIAGASAEPALRSVLRGILGRARYTVEAGLHLGLAAPLYLHFTSPIRRYADLAVHRLIKSYLAGDRHWEVGDPQVAALCEHLNTRAELSAKAESLRRRMLLAEYMARRIGEEFEARVTRVLPVGLVAQLDASWVEGLLPWETLPGGPWRTEPWMAQGAERRFFLGTPVRVRVVATDPSQGRIEYALVET